MIARPDRNVADSWCEDHNYLVRAGWKVFQKNPNSAIIYYMDPKDGMMLYMDMAMKLQRQRDQDVLIARYGGDVTE
jgi:hypothetical protein